MNRVSVMQITDTLIAGGLERVAVNMANSLPQDRFLSHLCTTRLEGPLVKFIEPHVKRLTLARRGRFDTLALQRLASYNRAHRIKILHAHGTSLFFAVFASLLRPYPAVIWHDHFGRYQTEERPAWIYRLAARFLSAVVAVNNPLAEWSRSSLHMPAERVWYIPNFVCEPGRISELHDLPGTPGQRIVCVANLRQEKDHLNLLSAMELVVQKVPAAHLILLGNAGDPAYLERIQARMKLPALAGHVTWLGSRNDVSSILRACDIGVLSSASEGLPLALIEYGMSGLPAVATRVGQCEEVLENGRAGLLVPTASPQALAQALLLLLCSTQQRDNLGKIFQQRVRRVYSVNSVMGQMCGVYDSVLKQEARSK